MIWRPFNFDVQGEHEVLPPQPALRSMNGLLIDKGLLLAAQAAFFKFMEGQRASHVINAQEVGRLRDGTPYRIVTVGKSRTMLVWPQQPAEDLVPGFGGVVVYYTGVGHIRLAYKGDVWEMKPIASGYCGGHVELRKSDGVYFLDNYIGVLFPSSLPSRFENAIQTDNVSTSDGRAFTQQGLAFYLEPTIDSAAVFAGGMVYVLDAGSDEASIFETKFVEGAEVLIATLVGTVDVRAGGFRVLKGQTTRTSPGLFHVHVANNTPTPTPPLEVYDRDDTELCLRNSFDTWRLMAKTGQGAAVTISPTNLNVVSAALGDGLSGSTHLTYRASFSNGGIYATEKYTNTITLQPTEYITKGPYAGLPMIEREEPRSMDATYYHGFKGNRVQIETIEAKAAVEGVVPLGICPSWSGDSYRAEWVVDGSVEITISRNVTEIGYSVLYDKTKAATERKEVLVAFGKANGEPDDVVNIAATLSPPSGFSPNASLSTGDSRVGAGHSILATKTLINDQESSYEDTTTTIHKARRKSMLRLVGEPIPLYDIDLEFTKVEVDDRVNPPTESFTVVGVASAIFVLGVQKQLSIVVGWRVTAKDFQVVGAIGGYYDVEFKAHREFVVFQKGEEIYTEPANEADLWSQESRRLFMDPLRYKSWAHFRNQVETVFIPTIPTPSSIELVALVTGPTGAYGADGSWPWYKEHLERVTLNLLPRHPSGREGSVTEPLNLTGDLTKGFSPTHMMFANPPSRGDFSFRVYFAVDANSGGCVVVTPFSNVLVSPNGDATLLQDTTMVSDSDLKQWCASL